ncbi:hypothetical protein GUJ93_ZPchr0001g33100 [Zizania palustris]|uniref:Uncharacterized protein n=1 Tax=Zizania palustris TaxID=103762 RepID=A0A8J5RPH8_ZIZPA|nr:hypothetical protein GUJ93_ZPchr0001g33100 [Zizania palustris]
MKILIYPSGGRMQTVTRRSAINARRPMMDSCAVKRGTFARPSSPKITFESTEDLLEGNNTGRTGIIAKWRRSDRDSSRKGWVKGTQNRSTRAVSEKDGPGEREGKEVTSIRREG